MASLAKKYLRDKDEHFKRLEYTRLAFLEYVNANCASCIYFEGRIDDDEKALEAMRISLDAWDTQKHIVNFAENSVYRRKDVDYGLAGQWRDFIHGPLHCMEVDGQTALFMCEKRVFEVVSFGRPWDEMVPYVPDVVLTTLLPYDGIIVSDGLLVHHHGEAFGPGVQRVQGEFEEGLAHGVVKDARAFAQCAREINELHNEEGFDPTSYYLYADYINQINFLTSKTCFPYRLSAFMRQWDDE